MWDNNKKSNYSLVALYTLCYFYQSYPSFLFVGLRIPIPITFQNTAKGCLKKASLLLLFTAVVVIVIVLYQDIGSLFEFSIMLSTKSHIYH